MYHINCAHVVIGAPLVSLLSVDHMRMNAVQLDHTTAQQTSAVSKSGAISPPEGSRRKGNWKMMLTVDYSIKALLALSLDILIKDEEWRSNYIDMLQRGYAL